MKSHRRNAFGDGFDHLATSGHAVAKRHDLRHWQICSALFCAAAQSNHPMFNI
jgi:hypothetical protein